MSRRACLGRPGEFPARSEPVPRRRPLQRRPTFPPTDAEHPRSLRRIGRELDHLHGRPGQGRCLCRTRAGQALARAGARSRRTIGSYRFTDWSKDHPILSPFTDPQYGDLRTLRFQRITRLRTRPGGPGAGHGAGGRAAGRRESARAGAMYALCFSGRQCLGRLGHSSPLSAAGPSIARLPDQPAAGDQSA